MIAPPICLVYHRIAELDFDPFGLAVSPSRFADQLAVMRRFGEVLNAWEFDDCLQRGRFPRRAVLLTFDDGYEDNLTVACPALRAAGLPATFFLLPPDAEPYGNHFWWETLAFAIRSPDWPSLEALAGSLRISQADARSLIDFDRSATYLRLYRWFRQLAPNCRVESLSRLTGSLARPLSPEPLRLSATQVATLVHIPGMTVGSHGQSHDALIGRPRAIVNDELNQSLTRVRALGDRAVDWFAYPYGCEGRDFDEPDVALVRRCGFSAAFTVAVPSSSRRGFRRFAIERWCTSEMSADVLRRFLESRIG